MAQHHSDIKNVGLKITFKRSFVTRFYMFYAYTWPRYQVKRFPLVPLSKGQQFDNLGGAVLFYVCVCVFFLIKCFLICRKNVIALKEVEITSPEKYQNYLARSKGKVFILFEF